jgi:hypothetical protein
MEKESIIEALWKCATACENCASECLGEDDFLMMRDCIRLDRDCADVCRLTATLIARNSPHGKHLVKECIEVCERCAEECGQHDNDHCQACARACTECVEACRTL